MKKRISFWDALIWIGVILILGWALLKSFGIIHSPIWVEMIPYYGIGGVIIGATYKLGKITNTIESTNRKVNKISNDFSILREEFNKVKNNQMLCIKGKLKNSPYKYNH